MSDLPRPQGHEPEQLVLMRECCYAGCAEAPVGTSVRGEGQVCKHHNEVEWAAALARSEFHDWRRFAQRWLRDLNREEIVHA